MYVGRQICGNINSFSIPQLILNQLGKERPLPSKTLFKISSSNLMMKLKLNCQTMIQIAAERPPTSSRIFFTRASCWRCSWTFFTYSFSTSSFGSPMTRPGVNRLAHHRRQHPPGWHHAHQGKGPLVPLFGSFPDEGQAPGTVIYHLTYLIISKGHNFTCTEVWWYLKLGSETTGFLGLRRF